MQRPLRAGFILCGMALLLLTLYVVLDTSPSVAVKESDDATRTPKAGATEDRHARVRAVDRGNGQPESSRSVATSVPVAPSRPFLYGTVLSELRQPIVGAEVRARHRPTGVITDSEGRFAVRNDFNDRWPDAVIVTKAGRARSYVTIPRDASPPLEIILQPAVPIDGRAVDQNSQPVGGLALEVYPAAEPPSGIKRHRTVVTDAAGTFVFADTAEGDWIIAVSPLASQRLQEPWPKVTARAGSTGVILRVTTLKPDDIGSIDIRVIDAATGEPVDIAEALLSPANPNRGIHNGKVEVDKERVLSRNLQLGEWVLQLRSRDGREGEFEVSTDAQRPNFVSEVRMQGVGMVSGSVHLKDGSVPPDVSVLVDRKLARAVDAQGEPLRLTLGSSTIDRQGRFWFKNVTAGLVRIDLSGPVVGRALVHLKSGGVGNVDLTATEPAKVKWKILDVEGRCKVLVEILDQRWRPVAVCEVNGGEGHESITNLVGGDYEWRATFHGSASDPVRVMGHLST